MFLSFKYQFYRQNSWPTNKNNRYYKNTEKFTQRVGVEQTPEMRN